MKALVVYDSIYGNTEKIAKAIAEGIEHNSKIIRVSDLKKEDLQDIDSFIIGSPVHGGRASEEMLKFFKNLEKGSLKGVRVSAFDTRFEQKEQGFGLKMLTNMIGFASDKMIKTLESKGATQLIKPEGFIVTGREGPLKQGEIERAKEWGQVISILSKN